MAKRTYQIGDRFYYNEGHAPLNKDISYWQKESDVWWYYRDNGVRGHSMGHTDNESFEDALESYEYGILKFKAVERRIIVGIQQSWI